MNKKRDIKKHVNIHLITLVVTIFVVVLMDLLKMYSISPTAMIAFVFCYSLYIIVSTIIMLGKNEKK